MSGIVFDAEKVNSYVLPTIAKSINEISSSFENCNKIKNYLPSSFKYRSTIVDMSTKLNEIKNELNTLKSKIEKNVETIRKNETKNESNINSLVRQLSQIGILKSNNTSTSSTKNSNVKSAVNVNTSKKESTGAKSTNGFSSFFKKLFNGIKNANSKISSSFDSILKKANEGIKSISNAFNKFKNDASKLLISAGAKISATFSSLFKKKESTNKDVVNIVADETKDKNGLFENTTLLDENGSRIVYDKKQKLEDGIIEYYGENGMVIKRINVDGSCEFYYTSDSSDYYYDSLGRKVGGTWASAAFGININKIVVLTNGTKEYYSGGTLKRKEFPDGTYEKYYEESFQNVREVCSPDGSSKKYKEYKGEYYLAGEYNVDGSHKLYNSKNQLIEELNADGSCKIYSNKVWDKESQKIVFDENKTTLSYEKKADGTEYEYTYNKFGYLTIKCSDGSEKCYDPNNTLISEKLSDGTTKTYYKESGKLNSIENPDGSEKYYYESGNIRVEIDSAGKRIEYREDGTKKTEMKGKETIFYDENGNVKDNIKDDGSSINYWSDGTKVITYSDGSSKRYYPSGNLAFEKDVNGIQISYYENGVISQKGNPDGSYTTYDETGKPNMTIYPDGNVKFH